MSDLHVNENSDVYYQGGYWNDLEVVRQHLNARVSGDAGQSWTDRFRRATNRTFERALILNCGNGWVERDLVRSGLFREGVGIDYSQQLLDDARSSAEAEGLPLAYEQCDVNSVPLPAGPFDLVVNHAAAHHIAAIDGVFRQICRVLPEDGWFVSSDYVGPHRNQYTPQAWERMWSVNEGLPASVRQDLRYPHLPTMLVTDPTEAIHSELIMQTFCRYFTLDEFAPLGGAIAYPLLTHNSRLFDVGPPAEQRRWVEWVLEADDLFLENNPDSSLFAYFAGRPNKAVLEQADALSAWQREEEGRERRARQNGGEYYPRGALATGLIELEIAQRERDAAKARADALETEFAALNASLLYRTVRRVSDARVTRRLRRSRAMRAFERRALAALRPRR
jgi:SAM-dependent methyltransferase